MTIAFDASTVFDLTTSNSTTHTPAGTPKGVLIFVTEGSGTVNEITAITYGGVTVPLEQSASTDTAHAWFLGSSIPTGAQTVAFTSSGSVNKRAVIITVTAAADTQIEDKDQFTGTGVTDVTITFTTAVTTFIAGALHSGADTVGEMTSGASYTTISERDYGTNGANYQYITANAAAGSPVCDWTQTSNFARAVALAIKEAGGGAAAVVDPMGMSGFFGA